MTAEIATSLIAVSGAVILAGTSYWFTKKREREAELRKERLEHYKEFSVALSGILIGESTPDSQRAYSLIKNKLNLIAPYAVIKALQEYTEATSSKHSLQSIGKIHDELLSKLFYEMRKDLGISPRDRRDEFVIGLWSSGECKN